MAPSDAPDPDDLQTVHARSRSGPTYLSVDAERVAEETPEESPTAASPTFPERYRTLGMLGAGGMGEVWQVDDTVLHRTVALKVVRAQFLLSPHALQRFREEAQVAAQLQHPGIVPIHDLGVLADGRLWFTMKEVHGRTLSALTDEVHHAWRVGRPGYSFRRLMDAFLRVCETVGYAHSRGVVHRDLKPENIMVGDHGEVMVLDWGLAKVMGGEDHPVPEPMRGLEGRRKTRMGAISGTPAYMPPEQARGQQHRVGPWSDVYALGATLFDLLTERPPYAFTAVERVLDAVIAAEPIDAPSTLAEGHPGDEELDRICLKALSPRPDDRYPDAQAMAEDLAAWADGATRRERALGVVDEAKAKAKAARALDRKTRLLADTARLQLESLPPTADEAQRAQLWDLEDEADAVRREAAELRLDATQLLRSALTHAPDLAEAHQLLADEYHRQHVALEAAGRLDEARAVESLLRAHDTGQYAAYLEGSGAVTLHTDVPARVELFRYEPVRRRLQPVHVRTLGTTPLVAVALPMGSYLLQLEAPGRASVRYPVRIGRGEHWDGIPPGETEPLVLPLPRADEIGPDDVYVPAGWYWSSADHPVLTDPLPRQRVWCDGFLMRRFPVTNAEFLAFLNGLIADGRTEDALRWCPQMPGSRPDDTARWMYAYDAAAGRFELAVDAEGHGWRARMPVVRVDWRSADAFARAQGWRLPMDLEWEKAARGVDERVFPWGATADPTWARMLGTPGAPAGPADVGSFASDVSPYGLRDLGGNVFAWLADARPGPAPIANGRVVVASSTGPGNHHRYRGGAWSSAAFFCRSDLRRFANDVGSDTLGIRLVRSWPPR